MYPISGKWKIIFNFLLHCEWTGAGDDERPGGWHRALIEQNTGVILARHAGLKLEPRAPAGSTILASSHAFTFPPNRPQ